MRAGDFARWAGYEAKIELARPLEGRKRFRGLVGAPTEGGVTVPVTLSDAKAEGETTVLLPLADLADARLVLTEALVRESLRRGAAREEDAAEDADAPEEAGEAEPVARRTSGLRGPGRFAKAKPVRTKPAKGQV